MQGIVNRKSVSKEIWTDQEKESNILRGKGESHAWLPYEKSLWIIKIHDLGLEKKFLGKADNNTRRTTTRKERNSQMKKKCRLICE